LVRGAMCKGFSDDAFLVMMEERYVVGGGGAAP